MIGYKYHVHQLPAGWIGLVASEAGLRRATLKPTLQEVMEDLGDDADGAEHDPEHFAEVVDRLARYSEGDLSALDGIELDLEGVPPSSARLERLPDDSSRRDAQLPLAGGRGRHPKAMRAAGQAMARNRFSLIIPCHRVISSDGGLGGYGGGGLGVKARLLQMELEQAAEG